MYNNLLFFWIYQPLNELCRLLIVLCFFLDIVAKPLSANDPSLSSVTMTPPFSPETNTNNNLTISSSCNNNIDSNSSNKSCPVIKCTTIATTAAPHVAPELAKTDDSTAPVSTVTMDEKSIKTGPKITLATQNSVATMTSPAESKSAVVSAASTGYTTKMQQQKHQPLAKTNSNAKTANVVPPVVSASKENSVLPVLPSLPTPTSPTVHELATVVGGGQPFKLSYAQVAHNLKEQQPATKEENNNNISIVDKEKTTDKENKERKKDASPNSRTNLQPRGGICLNLVFKNNLTLK